jgi:sugar phosphate isomerase/epimerase
MVDPHIHIPYDRVGQYLSFIQEKKINLELYFPSTGIDSIRSADLINLKKALDYMPSLSIHAPFMDLSPGAVDPKVRAVTMERFLLVFDIAELLEPISIVFHSGYEKWKYALNVDLWLKKSLKTWNVLARKGAERNIKIVIENVFEDEPGNLRLLMEEIGSDHFGICFDTGHCNLFSTVPLEEWLGQLKPYILELHLHDNNGGADDHKAIGDGTFNFDLLFSSLQDKKLIYTIEGHSPDDVMRSMRRLNQYL